MVARIIKEIDPGGVEARKARRHRRVYKSEGANACWHVDGELQHFKIKIMYCIGVFLVIKIVPNK